VVRGIPLVEENTLVKKKTRRMHLNILLKVSGNIETVGCRIPRAGPLSSMGG
jgi:hypothetical protein